MLLLRLLEFDYSWFVDYSWLFSLINGNYINKRRIICWLKLYAFYYCSKQNLMIKCLKKWLLSKRTKSRKVLLLWILCFSQQSQVTAKYPDLCNSFILVPCMFYGTQFSICNYLNVNSDKDNDFIEPRIRDLLEIYKTSQKTESTPTLKSIQLILISYIFNHVVFIFLKSFSRLELFMIICCKKN